MPNQECNHLTFKSFSICVFCLHFCFEVVRFIRLPASRREQFSHFLCFHPYLCLLFLVSLISICHNYIVSRPFTEWDFQSGAETKEDAYNVYYNNTQPHASCSCSLLYFMYRLDGSTVAYGEHALVFMLAYVC